MIERVHQHIIAELQQGARTDTLFILTAVLLNLLVLAINSSLAAESREITNRIIVMFIFVALTLVVNLVAIVGLSKQTRSKLLNGLLKMYEDQGVKGYYDPSLMSNYNVRYNLFILTVVFTGLISIAVPFVIR